MRWCSTLVSWRASVEAALGDRVGEDLFAGRARRARRGAAAGSRVAAPSSAAMRARCSAVSAPSSVSWSSQPAVRSVVASCGGVGEQLGRRCARLPASCGGLGRDRQRGARGGRVGGRRARPASTATGSRCSWSALAALGGVVDRRRRWRRGRCWRRGRGSARRRARRSESARVTTAWRGVDGQALGGVHGGGVGRARGARRRRRRAAPSARRALARRRRAPRTGATSRPPSSRMAVTR